MFYIYIHYVRMYVRMTGAYPHKSEPALLRTYENDSSVARMITSTIKYRLL